MFTISIRRKAFADIRQVVSWLTIRFSATAATRWQSRATAAIRSLEGLPDRCPEADEAADLGVELRELTFGRGRNVYRVLFVIDGTTVNVHRIRHAAQDRLQAGDL